MESLLSFFACIGTMNLRIVAPVFQPASRADWKVGVTTQSVHEERAGSFVSAVLLTGPLLSNTPAD
jgi:hypothetical protein